MKATEVFTPGSFPTHTYVQRTGEHLETALRDGLDTPGQVVSLAGPSKSGKTVLVEKVVGRNSLITIPGNGIGSATEVWDRVLDHLLVPGETTESTTSSDDFEVEGKAKGGLSLFGLGKAEVEVGTEYQHGRGKSRDHKFGRRGLQQVVEIIANSKIVILIDDFHYMAHNVQTEVAKSIKEAVRLGITICSASVIHRADDVVRANPELRGRVRVIDLTYWKPEDLRRIATQGFAQLNAGTENQVVNNFVSESAGSPQLMQLICLQACFVLGLREQAPNKVHISPSAEQVQAIFEQSATVTDFRTLVDVLDEGPKTRGTDRKLYAFRDGTEGDVYRCVLKALAADPPQLTFSYDEITERAKSICKDEAPVGSSITGSCVHMARLALERFPEERVIDWDEQKQVLDLPNPYFLFYLRWSNRLQES